MAAELHPVDCIISAIEALLALALEAAVDLTLRLVDNIDTSLHHHLLDPASYCVSAGWLMRFLMSYKQARFTATQRLSLIKVY